jgi:hypothetical protein
MREEMIDLLMEQPFEVVMGMAARQGVTVKYDAHMGAYQCRYWTQNADRAGATETTTAGQKNIKFAVAIALVGMIKED